MFSFIPIFSVFSLVFKIFENLIPIEYFGDIQHLEKVNTFSGTQQRNWPVSIKNLWNMHKIHKIYF